MQQSYPDKRHSYGLLVFSVILSLSLCLFLSLCELLQCSAHSEHIAAVADVAALSWNRPPTETCKCELANKTRIDVSRWQRRDYMLFLVRFQHITELISGVLQDMRGSEFHWRWANNEQNCTISQCVFLSLYCTAVGEEQPFKWGIQSPIHSIMWHFARNILD